MQVRLEAPTCSGAWEQGQAPASWKLTAGCSQSYVDSMKGTVLSPSEDYSFLQAVRKRLGCAAFLDPNNNDERPNKNESKTKTVSVLSSEEGTEISLRQSEKCFSKLYPYGSGCVKPKSLHNMSSRGMRRAGMLRDLLTWEWCHCDPGGASRLTANRDRMKCLEGAGQSGHVFHTWSAFFPVLCSVSPLWLRN